MPVPKVSQTHSEFYAANNIDVSVSQGQKERNSRSSHKYLDKITRGISIGTAEGKYIHNMAC